jgi:acyl-CoA thioester hydrolase
MQRPNPTAERAGFAWPIRVYYEDTDAGGVVYHASYLRFLERARTEWLRSCGFDQDVLRREAGVIFAVRSAKLEFLRPARLDEALCVELRIAARRGASLLFDQTVQRSGQLLCRAEVLVVCLDSESLRPRPIPMPLAAAIAPD